MHAECDFDRTAGTVADTAAAAAVAAVGTAATASRLLGGWLGTKLADTVAADIQAPLNQRVELAVD